MLSVANKLIILSVVILIVIMLSFLAPWQHEKMLSLQNQSKVPRVYKTRSFVS
jgi:hypothetical protein